MTFSIIARDATTGAFGVATATGKIAVGAQVPHLRRGIGAIASQGLATNPLYADDGFALLAAGWRADEAVDALTRRDRGHEWRQLAVVDRAGRAAGFTGEANQPVAGLLLADNLAVCGNMLAGEQVLPAMHEAYARSAGRSLGERLLEALAAGAGQGGDRRGACSAALLAEEEAGWLLDLRIDDAERPAEALAALYRRSRERHYLDFRASLPDRSDPHRH